MRCVPLARHRPGVRQGPHRRLDEAHIRTRRQRLNLRLRHPRPDGVEARHRGHYFRADPRQFREQSRVHGAVEIHEFFAAWSHADLLSQVEDLTKEIARNPKSPELYLRRGELYRIHEDYGKAVQYSLETLLSYVEKYGDDDLVLVFLGDHQPASLLTGQGASRDVPITIVAHDPAVLARIADWGWTEGLRPGPAAPVWPMSAFRDRFLGAFSGGQG